ncbi:hypothetical protein Hanom_Chr11g00995381 [Helianthus anomalus]
MFQFLSIFFLYHRCWFCCRYILLVYCKIDLFHRKKGTLPLSRAS